MAPSIKDLFSSAGNRIRQLFSDKKENNQRNITNAETAAELANKYKLKYGIPSFTCEGFGKYSCSDKDFEEKFKEVRESSSERISNYVNTNTALTNYFNDLWKKSPNAIIRELIKKEKILNEEINNLNSEREVIRRQLNFPRFYNDFCSESYLLKKDFFDGLSEKEKGIIAPPKIPSDFYFMPIDCEFYFVNLKNSISACVIPNKFFLFRGDSLYAACKLSGFKIFKTDEKILINVCGQKVIFSIEQKRDDLSEKEDSEKQKIIPKLKSVEAAQKTKKVEPQPDVRKLIALLDNCSPDNIDLAMIEAEYNLYWDSDFELTEQGFML